MLSYKQYKQLNEKQKDKYAYYAGSIGYCIKATLYYLILAVIVWGFSIIFNLMDYFLVQLCITIISLVSFYHLIMLAFIDIRMNKLKKKI